MFFETDHDGRTHGESAGARETSALTDLIIDLEQDARTRARAIRRAARIQGDTHWSRILSYDLSAGDDEPIEPMPMHDEAGARGRAGDRVKNRFVSGAVVVFGAGALLYLAVTGGLHALSTPDGTAAPVLDQIGVPADDRIDMPARDGIRRRAPDHAVSPNRLAHEDHHAGINPIE